MLENSFDLLVWLKDKNKGSAELQPLRADLKGFTLTTPKKSSGQLVHPSRQTDGLVAAKVAQPLREKGSAKARKERWKNKKVKLYHKFLSVNLKNPYKFIVGKGGKVAVQRKKLKNKYKANLTNLRGKSNIFLKKIKNKSTVLKFL